MNGMASIIKWLREIEQAANQVYLQAASLHASDPQLKEFLEQISEDEALHYHVMGSAAEYLADHAVFETAVSVDEGTRHKIEKYFSDMKTGLASNTFSRDELVERIITVELSEWNDLFLYVVNVLREKVVLFKYPAAKIQSHLNGMKYFLEIIENRPEVLKKITSLSPIWVENILIVDDNKTITSLFKALLNRDGNIDVAHNGEEALRRMEKKYYRLVVSDIDMPVMDGISFFKEAEKRFPSQDNKFLFISGNVSPERQAFFNEAQVQCLLKPVPINVLREEAAKILLSATKGYFAS